MKKSIIIVAACVLMAGPAAAQSIGEKTGINSVLGISPSTPDFVKEVAIGDMFEIESSKLAAQRATDEATKNFANQMVKDHTKTSTELKEAVSNDPKTPIPNALDSSHQSKLDKLKGLTGEDFTKQYMTSGNRPQERRQPLRTLRKGRRQRNLEVMGRQNPPRPPAPSRIGARPG